MSFWNRVVQGHINKIKNEGADVYMEGMVRSTGCGAPGANAQEAAAIANDMRRGISALCSWVKSWFE